MLMDWIIEFHRMRHEYMYYTNIVYTPYRAYDMVQINENLILTPIDYIPQTPNRSAVFEETH